MPKYTVVIFIGLVVIGAIVAWIGDALGARLGKQRASIFGLRPRQSARLVAVVIGALLPLIGLGVAMAGSEYARIAVLRLDRLLDRQKQLTGQVDDLQKNVEVQTRAARAAEDKAMQAQERARHLDAERVKLEGEVGQLQDRQAELRAKVQDLEGRVREAEQKVREAEQKLRESEQKLRDSEQKLKESETKLAEAKQKRKEVEEANIQLEEENEALTRRRNALNRRVAAARRHEADAKLELEGRRKELALAEQELADRKQELADLRDEFAAYREQQSEIAEVPALFNPGDELIRVVLSAEQTQDQLEAELWELLHLASPIAEAKGAPVGDNGRAIVAVAPVPRGAPSARVPEREVVRHVASELRRAGGREFVVLLQAFRRLSYEDRIPLEVRFLAVPNRLLFKEGEVLVAMRISANSSRAEVFEALWRLIADPEASQVRALARAKGMLPHPETGQYGSFTLADMCNAVDQILVLKGMVPVQIVAAQDTYTKGPLAVKIQVGEREGS